MSAAPGKPPFDAPGLGWATLCAAIAAAAAILLLGISGWFLTGAALAGAAGSAAVLAFNYLLPSAAIRALAILRTAGRYGERLLSHRAALRMMAGLRGSLFERLAAQDGRTAPDLSGGDASARLIGDIEALEDLVVRRPVRPASIVAAAVGLALVLFAGWRSALALLMLLTALPFVIRALADRLTAAPARDAAALQGRLRDRFVELAAARSEILAYGLASRVTGELSGTTLALDRARAALFRADAIVAAVLAGYGAGAAALVLALAQGPAPAVAMALLAAVASVEAMASIARSALREASVRTSLERLDALVALDMPGTQPTAPAPAALPLSLGQPVGAGARVAITGASGSGKTLLVEALAGLRPAMHRLSVGGADLADCPAATLRRQFALSPQDATLIAGSIGDNLRLARTGVTEGDMWEALETACLAERVAAMPHGLQTMLGEGGGSLSGGERKRLSLARALLAGRPWLILDEPSEGLDAATEDRLIARLRAWLDRSGAGLILVSHRGAPLILADTRIAIAAIARRSGFGAEDA